MAGGGFVGYVLVDEVVNIKEPLYGELLQMLLLLALAPGLYGVAAGRGSRLAASLGRCYKRLARDLRAGSPRPPAAARFWVSCLAWGTALAAGLMAPTFFLPAPLGFTGDAALALYLLLSSRFFAALAAGRPAGPWPAAALLLAAAAALLRAGTANFGEAAAFILAQEWAAMDLAYWLAAAAFLLFLAAEAGRPAAAAACPDPARGVVAWAGQIRFLVGCNIFITLFCPWGIGPCGAAAFGWYALKLGALGGVLAVWGGGGRPRRRREWLRLSLGLSLAAVVAFTLQ